MTTKMHAVTGKNGRLVDFTLTAGQCGDAPQGETARSIRRGTNRHDRRRCGNDSDTIRQRGRRLKAKVCIKPNGIRKVKKRYDKTVYQHRNPIERFFGRIKQCRRVATRYEK